MKTILMVLAPVDFRDEEYAEPRQVWENAGYNVLTTSTTKESIGRFGTRVVNDFLLDEVELDTADAVFFVGGGGCLNFMHNRAAENLARIFITEGKPLGAICAAPRLLLNWGLLSDKDFTGWNGDDALENLAAESGANYTGDSVTVDGMIVTGDGPESARETGKRFLGVL